MSANAIERADLVPLVFGLVVPNVIFRVDRVHGIASTLFDSMTLLSCGIALTHSAVPCALRLFAAFGSAILVICLICTAETNSCTSAIANMIPGAHSRLQGERGLRPEMGEPC
jgi:hypothetical protein